MRFTLPSSLFFLFLRDTKRLKKNKLRVKIFTGCDSGNSHQGLPLEGMYKIWELSFLFQHLPSVVGSLDVPFLTISGLCVLTSEQPQEEERNRFMRTGRNSMPPAVLPGKTDSSITHLGSPLSLQTTPPITFTGNGVKPLDRTELMCPVSEGETSSSRLNRTQASQPSVGWGGQPGSCFLNELVVFCQTTQGHPQNGLVVFSPIDRKVTDGNSGF